MADIDRYPDRIAELFENKTILITGATGFIGKLLVEKLLRSCSDLKKIFVIIRTERNKSPAERFDALKDEAIFDLLKQQKGDDIMKKVEPIAGDIRFRDIALSKEDRDKLKEEVDIIIHSAATVKFNESLKTAILLNVLGTKAFLKLALECKKLSVFVHLSTAYNRMQEKVFYEKLYPSPGDPHRIIELATTMPEKEFEGIKNRILGPYPNTYSFTKALAEGLIAEQMSNLPVIVLRPSVVIPIWREPIPGWTDSTTGIINVLLTASKGLTRILYCNGNCHGDFVPADIVVNAILAATFDYVTNKKRRIFNVTTLFDHKINYFGIRDLNMAVVNILPFNNVVWYPKLSLTQSKMYYKVRFYLLQMLPAVIADMMLFLLGKKPYFRKVENNIHNSLEVLDFYANNQWEFRNSALLALRSTLNPRENQIYKIDCKKLDCIDYYTNCVRSVRRHILHETDDTIPLAKRHLRIMWYVDLIIKTIFAVGMMYLLWNQIFRNILSY